MDRNPFFAGAGGVVSADIAVAEHEREVAFYSKVLTTGDKPFWRDDLMNNLGQPIVGLGPRTPEYDAIPQQWLPHFQVSDVGKSAASTLELGGKELMHHKSAEGESQWAVMMDPTGAAFGLIPEVGEDAMSALKDETHFGRIVWLSLASNDVTSTCEFYERVVGWSRSETESTAGCEMEMDGKNSSAIIHSMEGEGKIPPVWMIHLPVNDLAASLKEVLEQGGQIVHESDDKSTAVICDPIGVHFAIQQH